MNLREIINYISGHEGNRVPQSALPPDYGCPDEADLLALTGDRLSRTRRAEMEKHLAGCDDCRDTLALFIHCSGQEALDSSLPQMSETEINKQAARVMAYINQDAEKQDSQRIRRPIEGQTRGGRAWAGGELARQQLAAQGAPRAGVYISFAQLAMAVLLVCAVATSVVLWVNRKQSPGGNAMQALALASSKKRRIEPSVSGEMKYSPYSTTRGMDKDDDLQFDIALHAATEALEQNPSPITKHELARVYLLRGKRGEIDDALRILEQLREDGNDTAEVLNDLGVAFLALDEPRKAADWFGRAIERDPSFDDAYFNRALARQGLDDREGARKDLEQFIKISTDQGWKDEAKEKLERLQDSPQH